MRAIWKGAVSFGLVNVPVRLYSATENHDISLHQVRASDGSRIRYKRVAQADGEEVPYKEIAKAYETEDGKTVVLTDQDLASLPNRSSKEIEVERFVPIEQIDPILFDKPYFIEPDAMGAKAYGLLREALRESDRVAVVTVSLRTRMTMAVLRVVDDVIVLQTLLWPDEVRDSARLDNLDQVSEPKKAEVAMARMLVDSMAGDFEPEGHVDDFKEALEALVQSKIEGGDVTEAPESEEEAESGEVVDLLAALQRSVDRAKKGRGEKASGGSGSTTAEEGPGRTVSRPGSRRGGLLRLLREGPLGAAAKAAVQALGGLGQRPLEVLGGAGVGLPERLDDQGVGDLLGHVGRVGRRAQGQPRDQPGGDEGDPEVLGPGLHAISALGPLSRRRAGLVTEVDAEADHRLLLTASADEHVAHPGLVVVLGDQLAGRLRLAAVGQLDRGGADVLAHPAPVAGLALEAVVGGGRRVVGRRPRLRGPGRAGAQDERDTGGERREGEGAGAHGGTC